MEIKQNLSLHNKLFTMSYQIENYRFDEIIELKDRGKIVPTLFWTIPVGNQWIADDLGSLQYLFTNSETGGKSKKVGLLLVKDLHEIKSGKKELIDLTPLAANLAELFPKFDNQTSSNKFQKSVLIVSSNYPQPGWGVLIDVKNIDNSKLVSKINSVLESETVNSIISQSSQTSLAFNELNTLENTKPQKEKYPKEIEEINASITQVSNILASVSTQNNIKTINNKAKTNSEIGIRPLNLIELNQFLAVSSIRESENVKDLCDEFTEFLKNHKGKNLMSELPQKFKSMYANFINCGRQEMDFFLNDYILWYETNLNKFNRYYEDIRNNLYAAKGKSESEVLVINSHYRQNIKNWVEEKNKALAKYRYESAILNQQLWLDGPSFLIEIQKKFADNSIIISWDLTRMIGWKFSIALNSIDIPDILDKVRETFSVDFTDEFSKQDSKLDGSYFSDILHSIVEKKITSIVDRRDITLQLLSSLLKLNERKQIYEYHKLTCENSEYNLDEMVTKLGWPKSAATYRIPLASYLVKYDGDIYTLRKGVIYNNLRICLESYSKDLIRVITSNLEKKGDELYSIVEESYPRFIKHYTGNWSDEINEISLGSAYYLIGALGAEWQPDKKSNLDNLTKNLKKAGDVLNASSHHKEKVISEELHLSVLNESLSEVIKNTRALITEMPWHFSPDVIRGEFPSVLTGKAWSHCYEEDKIIRILIFDTESNPGPTLVWNPTKRNPIMTDCKIIRSL